MENERYVIKAKKIEAKVQEHRKSRISTVQALMKQQKLDSVHKPHLKGEIRDTALVKHEKSLTPLSPIIFARGSMKSE